MQVQKNQKHRLYQVGSWQKNQTLAFSLSLPISIQQTQYTLMIIVESFKFKGSKCWVHPQVQIVCYF